MGRIPVWRKHGAAECTRDNTSSFDKTLNGYREYKWCPALVDICCSVVIVIIKGCLLGGKVELIAI